LTGKNAGLIKLMRKPAAERDKPVQTGQI